MLGTALMVVFVAISALPGLMLLWAVGYGMVEDHRRQIKLGNQLVADAIDSAYWQGREDEAATR